VQRPREPILSGPVVTRAARVAVVAWALVGLGILVYLIGRFVLYPIRIIFPPLVLALIIVYLLNPVVSALHRRGIRRGWGTLFTYVVFLSALGVGLAYLIPIVSHQVVEFGKSIPDLLQRAQDGLASFARKLGLNVKPGELVSAFGTKGTIGSFIGRITSITSQVLHVALIVVLGPVLAFYFLVDLPKVRRAMEAAIPSRRRPEVLAVGSKVSEAIGGYFRGQLLVALFVGLASMLGLFIVGLPYWAPVGLIAGLFNLIPLIGPFIGAIPALFIAFTAPASGDGLLHPRPGWPLAVAASIVLLVVQQIDNHIISPNVMKRTVKLHPLTVMISLLAAGTLAGLWGMLLAIPVVASAKIMLMHYWDTRMVWPPPAAKEGEVEPEARQEQESTSATSRTAEQDQLATAGQGVSESPGPGTVVPIAEDDSPVPEDDSPVPEDGSKAPEDEGGIRARWRGRKAGRRSPAPAGDGQPRSPSTTSANPSPPGDRAR